MENYTKLRVIGKGSYGEVWLVKHKRDRKQVLKICLLVLGFSSWWFNDGLEDFTRFKPCLSLRDFVHINGILQLFNCQCQKAVLVWNRLLALIWNKFTPRWSGFSIYIISIWHTKTNKKIIPGTLFYSNQNYTAMNGIVLIFFLNLVFLCKSLIYFRSTWWFRLLCQPFTRVIKYSDYKCYSMYTSQYKQN